MRSIRTDSACIARHRSSARPVIFEYFTPASGLNSNVVTTGPGMNLHDAAFDRELAALLLEQPRAVHQLALVDLALGLRRVEQRQRRQRVVALAAFGRRLRRRLRIERQRRRRQRDLRRLRAARTTSGCRTRASAASRRGAFSRPVWRGASRRWRRPAAWHPRAARALFFVCFAMTSRRCCSRRRVSRHSANDAHARGARPGRAAVRIAPNSRPNENCVDMMTARTISVRMTMSEPVRFRYSESSPARATRPRSRRPGTACRRPRACRTRG